MQEHPAAVVFDVNETLSDMAPMAGRFADLGASPTLAKLWFASVLRDGFAAGLAGGQRDFALLARDNLKVLLGPEHRDVSLQQAVEHVMSGFMELPVHADVVPGVRALQAAGVRMVALSNGSAEVSAGLLERAGIRDAFEALLSVEQAGAWKPAPVAYRYAATRCGLDLSDMLLVAVHPWDVDGAARAGMRTAWLRRTDIAYPEFAAEPDHTVDSLTALAELVAD